MPKYRSSKLAQKKKKEFQIKTFLFLVIFVCLVFVSSQVSKINYINIQKINILGNNTIEESLLKDIVSDNIEGNYFWLFPKKNIILLSRENIKKDLLDKFLKINNVEIDLDLPNTLNIKVVEREPYALWCDKVSEVIKEKCFFVDNDSFIFEEAPDFSENIFFKYYSNLNIQNQNNLIGNFVFEKERFKEIDSFIQFIKGIGLKPYKFIAGESKNEIYFGEESKIFFNDNQDIHDITDTLQAVLNMKDFDALSVDYIDLRFGNKIFYK